LPDDDPGGWPYDEPAGTEAEQWPHDLDAEKWLLAILMRYPDALDQAIDTGWNWADMYRPWHEDVGRELALMIDRGTPPEPLVLIDALGRADVHRRDHGLIQDLWTWPTAGASHAVHYASAIHELAMKRRLIEGGIRQAQLARDGADTTAAEILSRSEADLAAVTGGLASAERGESPRQLAADERAVAHNWVVPGLMDVGDKIILVGWEGHGKTLLLYQFAMAVAAGWHPFLPGVSITAQRALLVNLEVGRGMLARTTRKLLGVADAAGPWDDSLLRVWSPDDLDLRTADGQMALSGLVRRHRPRLLCAGPMYHMGIAEGQAEGADYLTVAKYLHRLARRYECALLLEQHAPLAQAGKPRVLRPIGSVLWTKWPDFGWGLRPVAKSDRRYELYPFRDPREERAWPTHLYWRRGPGWPWAAEYPEHAFEEPMRYDSAAVDDAKRDRADELAARRAANGHDPALAQAVDPPF
jgi:AAA domain-containing protein